MGRAFRFIQMVALATALLAGTAQVYAQRHPSASSPPLNPISPGDSPKIRFPTPVAETTPAVHLENSQPPYVILPVSTQFGMPVMPPVTVTSVPGLAQVPPPPGAPTVMGPAVPPGSVVIPAMDPYGNCQTPPPATGCCSCDWGLFGGYLLLKPRGADVPFAVEQSLVVPGAPPLSPVTSIGSDYSSGFRAGAFVMLSPEGHLDGRLTWFESSTDETAFSSPANVLNPLVMFPGTFDGTFIAQQATATYDVDFKFIDIDYHGLIAGNEQFCAGYLAGARYGELDQSLSVTYPFAPPNGTTVVTASSDFHGVGPRIGLEADRVIFPNYGLRVYGITSASFLVGEFRTSYLQTNEIAGIQANTGLSEDRIVPILDLEIGLAWVNQSQCLRISAGYLVSAWFNTVTVPEWIQSVQRGDFQPGSDTLTFDGLTAQVEVRF